MFDDVEVSSDIRSRIAAEILQELWSIYLNIGDKVFLQEYKDRSILIGKEIQVISGENIQIATALEIDDDCRLKVKLNNGVIKTLSSGEVSVKL